MLGDHFGQRAEGEPAGLAAQHLRGDIGGRVQCESVFGQRRGGPKLPAGLHGLSRGGANFEQVPPVAVRTLSVDQSHQAVEVCPRDEVV